MLEPRHLLARRGGNRLLDADGSSGEKLRRCLGRGDLRERLCETVVKRLVAPLEVGQRRPRVRVPAVLVEDQGLEDERLGEESFLEERRVQREQISQSSLVLAAAEMRPARLEQRVEPLRRPSSHAVVEGRRQCVVAPLVSEPRELEVRFLASLGRGRITARNVKRRHGEELFGGLRGISCRQRRQRRHLARLAFRGISRRNRSGQRPGKIELALRLGRQTSLWLRSRRHDRLRRAQPHLRRQLLVERVRGRGRVFERRGPAPRLESGVLVRRSNLQRPLQVIASDRHGDGGRQLSMLGLLREQELR